MITLSPGHEYSDQGEAGATSRGERGGGGAARLFMNLEMLAQWWFHVCQCHTWWLSIKYLIFSQRYPANTSVHRFLCGQPFEASETDLHLTDPPQTGPCRQDSHLLWRESYCYFLSYCSNWSRVNSEICI